MLPFLQLNGKRWNAASCIQQGHTGGLIIFAALQPHSAQSFTIFSIFICAHSSLPFHTFSNVFYRIVVQLLIKTFSVNGVPFFFDVCCAWTVVAFAVCVLGDSRFLFCSFGGRCGCFIGLWSCTTAIWASHPHSRIISSVWFFLKIILFAEGRKHWRSLHEEQGQPKRKKGSVVLS